MPQDSQTSSLPLNQWRFVCMYVHYTICLCIHPQLHWKCPNVNSCNSFTSCKIQKPQFHIFYETSGFWSYIKNHHHTPLKKKNTHTSVFSDDFTQKVPLYPGKITRFRPLQRFRLVIPDPFLSVRRAIGTRFYAPPRVAGSVSRRFHATPWFGSGFGPPGEPPPPQLPWVSTVKKIHGQNRPEKSPRKNLGSFLPIQTFQTYIYSSPKSLPKNSPVFSPSQKPQIHFTPTRKNTSPKATTTSTKLLKYLRSKP